MQDIVIRPSMKFIKAGYALVLLIIAASAAVHYLYLVKDRPTLQPWLPIASVVLLLWPIKRHIQRQSVKVTITGDKLRYEVGLTSKSTRIIQIPKIQDVRVVQSMAQRLFGIGDIAIETAGENSRLIVEHLDRPQELAEKITDLSSHPSGTGVA